MEQHLAASIPYCLGQHWRGPCAQAHQGHLEGARLCEGAESLPPRGVSLAAHGWPGRLGGKQTGARRHPEGSLQAHFWRPYTEGEGLREGPSLSTLYFPSEGDARQPCRRRVVAQVVQRAEMTRIAPECILPRVVQAGLKVRMVTGPQKAAVGPAEARPRGVQAPGGLGPARDVAPLAIRPRRGQVVMYPFHGASLGTVSGMAMGNLPAA